MSNKNEGIMATHLMNGIESHQNGNGSCCISHSLIELELFEKDNVRYISMSNKATTLIVPLDNIAHELKKILRK